MRHFPSNKIHVYRSICRVLLLIHITSASLASSVTGSPTQVLSNSTSYAAKGLNSSESPFLPKAPNFITCDPFYGTDLPADSCGDLARDIFPGQQHTAYFYEWKRTHLLPRYKVPIVFDEPEDYPGCVLTVDLAGKTSSLEPVDVNSEAIISTAKAIVDRCIIDGDKRQGGFGTARFTRTAKGMAEANPGTTGYDAPLFLTVTVHSKQNKYRGPGDYDPLVNQNLQAALQQLADKAWFKKTKAKIAVVINALQATFERMNIAGQNAWWNNVHFSAVIPDHVSNLCNQRLGRPIPLQCERASFNFIRKGQTGIIKPKKPIVFRYGFCAFEIKTEQPLSYSWDGLRSAADSLLNDCLLAGDPNPAPGWGGEASYVGPSRSGPANLGTNTSVTARDLNGTTAAANLDWPQGLLLTMKSTQKPQFCSSLDNADGCTLDDEMEAGSPSVEPSLSANQVEATS